MGGRMRLFIAIQLDDTIKNALTGIQAALRAARVSGNYTKIENLHLTLAFIGEYGDPDRVLDAMRTVPFTPIPIQLEGFGSFGDLYWCGLARRTRGGQAYERQIHRLRCVGGLPCACWITAFCGARRRAMPAPVGMGGKARLRRISF